ncbi:MAG TPA: hypothetical protein VIY30_16985 [Burkholderiaceae bacterium]
MVVIAIWLGMLLWLMGHSDGTSEITWSRWLTVLASLEAVAFAAAGAVFGTTVQRQRVAEAKERTAKAEDDAKANATAAVNGRVLATVIKQRKRKSVAAPAPSGDEPFQRVAARRADEDDELVTLAEKLFPD